ncbi:MAG: hypothetical protein EOO27_04555 [Comamonadaceae bacterium]|nr:MAG: hypothetical protein EOO27_04555 [Comamonadaceae bacterium]
MRTSEVTGGQCTGSPAVLVIVRPNRHRVPVRRLIPTRRHASELPTPCRISRANCSRFSVRATPGCPPSRCVESCIATSD